MIRSGPVDGGRSVGILSTKLKTQRQEEITIPNAVLVSSKLTNFSRLADAEGMGAATVVSIGYDAPWRQVHAILKLAAARTPGIRKTPAPYVQQRALRDFCVEYELRFRIEDPMKRFDVLSELRARIQDAFNEFGVQIMSPHFVSQPAEAVVVPKEHWHTAPADPAESKVGADARGIEGDHPAADAEAPGS